MISNVISKGHVSKLFRTLFELFKMKLIFQNTHLFIVDIIKQFRILKQQKFITWLVSNAICNYEAEKVKEQTCRKSKRTNIQQHFNKTF